MPNIHVQEAIWEGSFFLREGDGEEKPIQSIHVPLVFIASCNFCGNPVVDRIFFGASTEGFKSSVRSAGTSLQVECYYVAIGAEPVGQSNICHQKTCFLFMEHEHSR